MKFKKVLLVAAMTAAFGAMNMFAAFADDEINAGWNVQNGNWYYYNESGVMVRNAWIEAENGDGRGNEVWYYVDSDGRMLANETRVIDGVSYYFNEDGSWLKPYQGATKGSLSGKTFTNSWSNIRLTNMIGTPDTSYEAEDLFSGSEYAAIGSPKITHDLYLTTDYGDLEIYYVDMSKKSDMDAASFASALAQVEKGSNGSVSAVTTVTVGGQNYSKVTVTKKKQQKDFYCRKQDQFMVVIYASGNVADSAELTSLVNSITTAH